MGECVAIAERKASQESRSNLIISSPTHGEEGASHRTCNFYVIGAMPTKATVIQANRKPERRRKMMESKVEIEEQTMAGKALGDYVAELAQEGYVIQKQDENSAQLVRKKKFSALWAAAWLLGFGVGVIFYIFYYLAKRDDFAYLQQSGGVVSGTLEYTRVRYRRAGLGALCIFGALLIMVTGGAIGGSVATVLVAIGMLIALASLGFFAASLFGWRRHEQIGSQPPHSN